MKNNKTANKSFKRLGILALVLGLFIGPLPVSSEGPSTPISTDAFVKGLEQRITDNWALIEKVWPGADYAKHKLLLFYVDDNLEVQDAWQIGVGGHQQLTPDSYKDIAVPTPGGYAQVNFEGAPSIAMSIDDFSLSQARELEQTFLTATHELVHFYHQDDMLNQAEGTRAQAFPLDPKPRVYRHMLYQNLINAFDRPANRDAYLGKAKYWLDVWQKEYQKESDDIRSTDILEGTAKYIENMGSFIGENLSGEPFDAKASTLIVRDEPFPSADAESYELGYVAGLLLDKTQPEWKKDFYKSGKSLVEMLLMPVKTIEEPINPDVEKLTTEEINLINSEGTEDMQDMIKARADKSVPMLKIDITNTAASYEAYGNYTLDNDDVHTRYSTQYRVSNGAISIKKTSVIMQATEDAHLYILVPLTMKHELNGDVLSVVSSTLDVRDVKVTTAQEDGRTIYSVTASDM